jgi:hypothetical protein
MFFVAAMLTILSGLFYAASLGRMLGVFVSVR